VYKLPGSFGNLVVAATLTLAACGGGADARLADDPAAAPVIAAASSPAGAELLRGASVQMARLELEADLAADPDRLDALNDLAISYCLDGHFDAARPLLDAVVAEGDPRAQQVALVNLGELYAVEGYLSAAAAYFETARGIDPSGPAPHYALALLADGRGDREGARAALREALRLDPEGEWRASLVAIIPAERLHLAALVAWVSGDRPRARALFRELSLARVPSLAAVAERHLAEP